MAHGLKRVVAPPQRHGSTQGLQIVATAARGTRVDQHVGMPAAEFIPVRQVTRDVVILRDPLPVRRVIGAPVRQWVDVEVLSIQVDTLFR